MDNCLSLSLKYQHNEGYDGEKLLHYSLNYLKDCHETSEYGIKRNQIAWSWASNQHMT